LSSSHRQPSNNPAENEQTIINHPYRRADRKKQLPVCPAFSFVQFLFFRTEGPEADAESIFLSISLFKKAEKKAVTAVKKTAKTAASAAKKAVKEVKNKVVKIEKAVTDLKKQSAAKAKEQGSASDRLTPQEIKEIEKHLLEMREEVQKRIRTKKEHEMPETEVGDEADVASQSLDKEVLFELNGNAQALLDQIESALRRISKGIYGTCEYCRCQIPKKRILALPFARYCIRCQTSNEGIKR